MSVSALVSIIVPVYNMENYLLRCLDSIAAQSYKNIEVILVDDGSTDSSGTMCDDYCLKDNRFRVIHQENKWLAEARNTGLAASKGDFLMFVDSDDAIHPRMVERMYDTFLRSGAGFIICDHREVDLDNIIPFEDLPDNVDFEVFPAGEYVRRLVFEAGKNSEFGLSWNKFIPKSLAGGLRFDNIYANEDVTYFLRLALRCKSVAYVRDQLYDYSLRGDSIMHAAGALDRWRYNHTLMRMKCLEYIPEDEVELRGYALTKMYRRMISSRFSLRGTEFEGNYEELVKDIVTSTRKEFLRHKGISLIEKVSFLFFWNCPKLGRLIYKTIGN